MNARRFKRWSRPIGSVSQLGLWCLLAVGCASDTGWTTSDPAMVADLNSVVDVAVRRSDAEGARRFVEVERRWSTKPGAADYGQLANDLLDVDRPIAAQTVLDTAERRFGADPEIASQIRRLRERVRLVEIRLELSSPDIDDDP